MQSARTPVAALLIALAAPVAASVYALGSTGLDSPRIGIAAAALAAVLVLSIGHGVSHRSRTDTPYW